VRVLESGLPTSTGVGRLRLCGWGKNPQLLDDKHGSYHENGSHSRKRRRRVICLPSELGKFEDHLTLILRD
jgi:hypothetical protein